MELLHQFVTQSQDILRLGAEQTAVPDLSLQLFLGQAAQLLRGIILREQPGRHLVHPLVRALGRQHHRHQKLKGRMVVEGCPLPFVRLFQAFEDGLDPFFLTHISWSGSGSVPGSVHPG